MILSCLRSTTVTAAVADQEEREVQTETVLYTPSDSEWQSLTRDKHFSYAHEREGTLEKKPANHFLNGFIESVISFFTSAAGKAIIWLLIATVALFIIVRIVIPEFRTSKRKRQLDNSLTGDTGNPESSEDLESGLWEEQMARAVSEALYADATRFAYLAILKLLSQKGQIVFRSEATDFDYYRELTEGTLKESFRNLLLRYQYAWFGRFPVAESEWRQTYVLYQSLKTAIR
ncbi:MAG: DUF4129 domain-containing protein [Chitinophagaceae bacterium]